ncbi:hypothetical protein QQP08_014162 [Theobroma cacao]|nr:hypothetical protein QQP08_014162 [Theobroma cacao]
MTKATWDKKVDLFKKLGWSEEEICKAFHLQPICMKTSEDKITRQKEEAKEGILEDKNQAEDGKEQTVEGEKLAEEKTEETANGEPEAVKEENLVKETETAETTEAETPTPVEKEEERAVAAPAEDLKTE